MTNKVKATQSRGMHTGKTIDGTYHIGDQLCQDSLGGLYACTNPEDDELTIKLLSGGVTVEAAKSHYPLHPNILAPLSVSTPGKLPRYLVLDNCVQTTLREWIKTRVHTKAENLIALMLQLTSAIHAIHESGKPLGNLCPETVFIGEDFMGKLEVYLIDANITFSARTMTQRLYQPMEQLKGTAPTIHSDVWAVGAMLYEAVYRRKPFTARNKDELLSRMETDPPGFSTFAKTSADFIRILKKCLAQNPEERYDSMTALGGDLLYLQQQSETNVSSEKAQKAIHDSIPAARRISVAPEKKEKSRRISLLPASGSAGRAQPPISQVPPARMPSKKRPTGKAVHSAVPGHASSRLSRPPRGAAVARRSVAPPEKSKKAPKSTKSMLTWEGSIIPKTDPDARQPAARVKATEPKKKPLEKNRAPQKGSTGPIDWPDEKVASAEPASGRKKSRPGRKSTIAFSAGKSSKLDNPFEKKSDKRDEAKPASVLHQADKVFSPQSSPKETTDSTPRKDEKAPDKVPTSGKPATAAVSTGTTNENKNGKRFPSADSAQNKSTNKSAARTTTDTSSEATESRTSPVPPPRASRPGRSRQQTVMGMPAVTVPIRPVRPAPPAQSDLPKPEPAQREIPPAPQPSDSPAPKRDSWMLLDDDEEKTLPVHPGAISDVIKSQAENGESSVADFFDNDEESVSPVRPANVPVPMPPEDQPEEMDTNGLFDDISMADFQLPVETGNNDVVLPASYLKEEGVDNPNHTYQAVTGAAPPRPTPVVPPPGSPDWGDNSGSRENQSSPEIVTATPSRKKTLDVLRLFSIVLLAARGGTAHLQGAGQKAIRGTKNLWSRVTRSQWHRSIDFPKAGSTARQWRDSAWRRMSGWGNRRQRIAAGIIVLSLLIVSIGIAIALSGSPDSTKTGDTVTSVPSTVLSDTPTAGGQPAVEAPLVNEASVAPKNISEKKRHVKKKKNSGRTKKATRANAKRAAQTGVGIAPPTVSTGNKKYNRRSALYSGDDDDDDDDAKYQRRNFDRSRAANAKTVPKKNQSALKRGKTTKKNSATRVKATPKRKVTAKHKAKKPNAQAQKGKAKKGKAKKGKAKKGSGKKAKKTTRKKTRKKAPPKSGWATNPFGG